MGYGSQSGQVLLRTQSAQGVFPADIGTAGIGMKLRGGVLGPNRELLIPDPEIGGGRDVTDAYLGASVWGGDYEFYARMNSLLTLFNAGLGDTTSPAPVAGVVTHAVSPVDNSTLPYLAIEEAISDGLEVFRYTDSIVNTLHLEADANGYLMGTVGLIAAKQTAGHTRTASPEWDETPLIVGTNIEITYNNVALPAKSFSFDLNNNFEDDDFRLGSFYIGDLTAKRREITAGFTIRETSSALWRQAVYGQSGATEVGGITTKAPLVITCETYETIPGGGAVPYRLEISIPNFSLTPYTLSVSGDDIIDSDLEGQALRPAVATDIMSVEIDSELLDVA